MVPEDKWLVPTCGCGPIGPADIRLLGGYPEIPMYCYYCGLVYITQPATAHSLLSAGWTSELHLDEVFLLLV